MSGKGMKRASAAQSSLPCFCMEELNLGCPASGVLSATRMLSNEERSGSILEFRLGKWPPRFRLSVHSDDGGSRLDYGVFRPTGMNRRSNDEGLREYLAAHVPGGGKTDVHWAWHRQVDEPFRDFSLPETLIEVEKIRRGERSTGEHALKQASDDLAELAAALDDWYSEVSQTHL